MQRKSSNTLVKRIVKKSLFHYLLGTTQDQTKISWMFHFEVAISQSSDHCYIHHAWNKTRHHLCSYQDVTVLFQPHGRTLAEGALYRALYLIHPSYHLSGLCISYCTYMYKWYRAVYKTGLTASLNNELSCSHSLIITALRSLPLLSSYSLL